MGAGLTSPCITDHAEDVGCGKSWGFPSHLLALLHLPCGKEAPLCDAAKHGLCEVAQAGDRNVLALSHAGWS